jgi:hypothetical protein
MEEGSEASGFKTPASSAGGGAAAEDASASKPKARYFPPLHSFFTYFKYEFSFHQHTR